MKIRDKIDVQKTSDFVAIMEENVKALRSKILVLLGAVGLIGLDQLFKWLAVRNISLI